MDSVSSEVENFASRHGIKIDTQERIDKVARLLVAADSLLKAYRKISDAEREADQLRREIVRLRIELEKMP